MEKRKRTIRKLMPVSPYNSAGLELWFSELASQGLFVSKTGYYFANFQRKEPRSLVYKLEPCDQYRDEHEKELTGQYRLAGWEAVGDVWRKYLIFSAVKDVAVSPEISGEIRSAGELSLKKTGHGCLLTCAMDAVLMALWCWMILGRFGFWYTTTMATPFLLCALMVFMFGINIFWRMSDYIQIRKYLKVTQESHAGRGRARSICSAAAVICICLVFIWVGEQKSWQKELSEAYTSLPVPPITAVSPENSPISGTVTYHSSIVAPVQFQIVQDGPDAQMLRMDYMELRFPRLVKPVLRNMMKDQLQWSSADPEAVSSVLFETAYVAVINDSMHYLFVSDGQKVASVCYIGPGYTDEFLKIIHDAMETWTQPELFLQ
ncbi:DUF2812 domain-containing protein [Hungatella effluvii]|uniref:DUF2812 domain-containing protein n=1 Tax=Hungatella effluvii TaxID=1096246 RepID=UPI0022E5ADA8|nr:DUF2812 domain-containing protein [Hungatella effluvii]